MEHMQIVIVGCGNVGGNIARQLSKEGHNLTIVDINERNVRELSDEIDVVATRNPLVLYDIETLTTEIAIRENKKLDAVKRMKMTKESFVLVCETDDEKVYETLVEMREKMQETLDLCKEVVAKRTGFVISQNKVVLKRI